MPLEAAAPLGAQAAAGEVGTCSCSCGACAAARKEEGV